MKEETHNSKGQQIRPRGSLTTLLCRSVCSIPQCVCLLNSYTNSSCPDATSHSLFYCHDRHPTKHKRGSLTNKEVLRLSLPHINNVNKVLFQELNANHWYLREEWIACNFFVLLTTSIRIELQVKDTSYFHLYVYLIIVLVLQLTKSCPAHYWQTQPKLSSSTIVSTGVLIIVI